MARSFIVSRLLILCMLLICAPARDQELTTMILAASRAGIVELIDPAALETAGRIHFDFSSRSVGLNGVSASADGSVLYVEGPISSHPNGCCELYSVDLATMRAAVVASFAGTRSRNAFVTSGSVTYAGTKLAVAGAHWHLSPDGRWLFGVRNFPGPVLDVYDVAQRQVVRRLVPPNQNWDGSIKGDWSGEHFYLFAGDNNGSGRLWMVSPDTAQLNGGVAVEAFGRVADCREPVLVDIVTVDTKVFLYETFGWKVDRRDRCPGVSGGASPVDPVTGQLSRQVAPDLHFSTLLADPNRPILYGLAPGNSNWSAAVQLVRINAADGRISQSRLLDKSFWRIALAPLSVIPRGDVRVVSP